MSAPSMPAPVASRRRQSSTSLQQTAQKSRSLASQQQVRNNAGSGFTVPPHAPTTTDASSSCVSMSSHDLFGSRMTCPVTRCGTCSRTWAQLGCCNQPHVSYWFADPGIHASYDTRPTLLSSMLERGAGAHQWSHRVAASSGRGAAPSAKDSHRRTRVLRADASSHTAAAGGAGRRSHLRGLLGRQTGAVVFPTLWVIYRVHG